MVAALYCYGGPHLFVQLKTFSLKSTGPASLVRLGLVWFTKSCFIKTLSLRLSSLSFLFLTPKFGAGVGLSLQQSKQCVCLCYRLGWEAGILFHIDGVGRVWAVWGGCFFCFCPSSYCMVLQDCFIPFKLRFVFFTWLFFVEGFPFQRSLL